MVAIDMDPRILHEGRLDRQPGASKYPDVVTPGDWDESPEQPSSCSTADTSIDRDIHPSRKTDTRNI